MRWVPYFSNFMLPQQNIQQERIRWFLRWYVFGRTKTHDQFYGFYHVFLFSNSWSAINQGWFFRKIWLLCSTKKSISWKLAPVLGSLWSIYPVAIESAQNRLTTSFCHLNFPPFLQEGTTENYLCNILVHPEQRSLPHSLLWWVLPAQTSSSLFLISITFFQPSYSYMISLIQLYWLLYRIMLGRGDDSSSQLTSAWYYSKL